MSSRRKRSPEEQARREKIRELLQTGGVSSMEDIQNLFKETIAEFLENGLDAELDDELGYSRYDYKNKDTENSRNGHSRKTLRTSFGDVEVSVPRDRKGEFDPQILKKNQTSISQDVEEKILSMYAKGMTTSDIEMHIRDIYGIEVSDTTVSRVTDKILPIAKEWQQRPLEAIYAVVFLDAIHYHVRSEGQIVKKAVYIAIGINLDGKKDVLGMWVGENESAKFWATVLNSLKNRGVEDIFIACTDNLTGFSSAIEAVFPKLNVCFTLSFSIISLIVFESNRINKVLKLFLYILILFLALLLGCEYGSYGILLVLLFHLYIRNQHDKTYKIYAITSIILLIIVSMFVFSFSIIHLYSILSLPIILLTPKNIQKIKVNSIKHINYLVYPLHLLIMFLIRFAIVN